MQTRARRVYTTRTMSKYITFDPKIMSGVPVITGTRIPVSRIVYLLSVGHTLDSVNKLYPHVKMNLIEAVITELIHDIDKNLYAKTAAL